MFYLQPGVEYLGAGENGDNGTKYGGNLFILKHIFLKQNQNFLVN